MGTDGRLALLCCLFSDHPRPLLIKEGRAHAVFDGFDVGVGEVVPGEVVEDFAGDFVLEFVEVFGGFFNGGV